MITVLDYTKQINDVNFRIHKKILWPCYEYSVSIKGLPLFTGNVFEDLILRLLNASDIKNSISLSEDTGLARDLVEFIIDRLQQKNFVKENLFLTAEGLAKVEESPVEREDFFYVYIDAITGKLLPMLERIDNRKEISCTEWNVEGKPDYVRLAENETPGNESLSKDVIYKIHEVLKKEDITSPTVDDVVKIIKKSKISMFKEPYIQISDSHPKFVYRVLDVFLQEENIRDFFASDGKGNISPFFTDALSHLNQFDQQYLIGLRTQNHTQIQKTDKNTNGKELSLAEKIKEKYQTIQKLKSELEELQENSSNRLELIEDKKVEFCSTLYSLLELSFFYLGVQKGSVYNLKHGVERIRSLIGRNHNSCEVIKILAITELKKLGFNVNAEIERNFTVNEGLIKISIKESGYIFPLCVVYLALSADAIEKSDFWFVRLNKYPDFFEKIIELKKSRNTAKHENKAILSKEKCFEHYEYFMPIFKEFKITEDATYSSTLSDKLTEESEIEEAIAKVEDDFGFALKKSFPKNFSVIIEDIERYSLNDAKINTMCIIYFDQILQQCFELLKNNVPNSHNGDYEEKYKKIWHKNLSELITIENKNIEKELKGKKISMKASFCAWLALEDINSLRNYAEKFPNLAEDVQFIGKLRKHGEAPTYKEILKQSGIIVPEALEQEEVSKILKKYKEFCFDFIKYLSSEGYFEF